MRPFESGQRACTLSTLGIWLAVTVSLAGDGEPSCWGGVLPCVFQSEGYPHAYALVHGKAAILIGAGGGADLAGLKVRGVEQVELVLLTHHHRDSCQRATDFVAAGISVRAPKKAEGFLLPAGARDYWQTSLPAESPGRFPPLLERSWNRWAYLAHPTGVEGIRCDLEEGQKIPWHNWLIEVVATPGHSPDHLAFVARCKSGPNPIMCFCGDALCAPGKVWSPYTLEWHHVNDDGLRLAADSLDVLAKHNPDYLCPEHGPPIKDKVSEALAETAKRLRRVAFLKSYERFTKEELGNPPKYRYLAEEQVASPNPMGNPKPWTKISPHLILTGNTYALASKDGPVLLVDPYAQNLPQRVDELKKDLGLGPVEVVTISHAHNDHYTGIFAMPKRDQFQVWELGRIAAVIENPGRLRAPYVDARPVKVNRRLKDGETVSWREYSLTFHHLPGQTAFTMGLEVKVDGKKCLFTGDNFYHMDQYTGSGGWSGFNRGLPGGYARSAQQVLDLRPDWILAEHGGAFEFNEEDFRRRLRWAQEAAKAADALAPSGDHAYDWDPHRIRVEPMRVTAIPGRSVKAWLVAANPSNRKRAYQIRVTLPKAALGRTWEITVPPSSEKKQEVEIMVPDRLKKGKNVLTLQAKDQEAQDASDVVLILDVE